MLYDEVMSKKEAGQCDTVVWDTINMIQTLRHRIATVATSGNNYKEYSVFVEY